MIRRTLLTLAPLAVVFLLLAGCSDRDRDDDAIAAPDDAAALSDDGDATDDESSDDAGAASGPDRPSITFASGVLPATTDPASNGFNLVERGAGETLTRIAHDQSVEFWLAESIEPIDDLTWEITLREGVLFWDGVELTAEHVVESFERAWERQPASHRFLSGESEFEIIDDHRLRLNLTESVASLPNNISVFQFIIYREVDDEAIMTGPYQPVELRQGDFMTSVAFDDYWGGTPPVAEITFRLMADGNARMLAVQSGDVDISTHAPPEAAAAVSGDVESVTVASTRVHYVILNHQQAPFNEPAVRLATNLAIDRNELNDVALGGIGQPISTIIPPGIGHSTPEQIAHDVEAAEALLDEAGWEMGDDGVRVRDGERLELTIKSYPFRPELTVMAVSMQDQLGRIGFDVSVEEVDDITSEIQDGDFQASMFSVEMLPTGDPHYALNTNVYSQGIYNYGRYESQQLDDLLDQIQREIDPDARDALLLEAQEIIEEDNAMFFLVAAPRAIVYRPESVAPFNLHSSDIYLVNLEQPRPAE
jgi:peptide/nickel transport system substrate-binding protein